MRIGELATATGTTTKALRFYEAQGLLPLPDRTSAGYRDYPADAIPRIDFIHRGQSAALTLAQIGQILAIRDGGQAPCDHVRDLLDTRLNEVDAQIATLTALRATLAALAAHAAEAEPDTCDPDQVCRYL